MKIIGYLVLVKYFDSGIEKQIFDTVEQLSIFLHQVKEDTHYDSVEIQTIYSHIN